MFFFSGPKFPPRRKISSEPPTKPLFLWGILKVEIENFKRDRIFQARLKISSEIHLFILWALRAVAQELDMEWIANF